MAKSKKILPSYFTALKIIFEKLRYGRVHNIKEIQGYTGFSKQLLNYWLRRMCEEGLLLKLDKSLYRMTDTGKRIYDQYERYCNKQLVRVENMHVSYKVLKDVEKLFGMWFWHKSPLKNINVYTAKIKNHTVRIIQTKEGYQFQVYVTKVLGESPSDAYYHARLEADSVALEAESFGSKLSAGWVSFQPEIAIPSPIASSLLTTTESSHIRTNKGVMNRSKGRYADWEPRNLQQAQKIVDMPDAIERIEKKLEQIEMSLRSYGLLYSNFSQDHWRIF